MRVRWYRRLIAGSSALPAADLLSRFVIDVDGFQHRDLRVRWPRRRRGHRGARDHATRDARSTRPPGSPSAAALLTSATLVPALAYRAARHQLRRQGQARATLVDELVEALDSATEPALAGRTERAPAAGSTRLRQDLEAIAGRDAVAAAIAEGLGSARRGRDAIGGAAGQHGSWSRSGSARSRC